MSDPFALVRRTAHRFRLPQLGCAGAVAIVTAVCAPLLLMVVGFTADYAYASYINQCLARAADAATLGAVSQTAATAVGGYSQLSGLQNYGVRYFQANTDQLSLSNVTFNLTVVSDGSGGVIATSTYSYNAPASFGSFIGISSIPLSGGAKTTARPLTYVNYYILVDTSQSMGIASTASDMTRLFALVQKAGNASPPETGCVFGCHVPQTTGNYTQPTTNESIAHGANPPVTLRIDSAVVAIQSIIAQAQAVAGTTKNIQFALYEIQANPQDGTLLHPVATLSSNYSSLQNAAASIDLGDNNGAGRGDSDFHDEIAYFNANVLPANGNGASATSPLNFVFIITDGAVDTYGWCNGHSHCTSAFDPNDCTSLKAKATVGTIYTTYLPIYNNNDPAQGLEGNYQTLVSSFVNQIGPNLQSCATSNDYYFQATEGPEIVTAMQNLFAKTQPSSARITQ